MANQTRRSAASPSTDAANGSDSGHFSASLVYAAARLYYTEEATQLDVASQLGVSRATVSRLLAEARRRGIVRIEVIAPQDFFDADLETSLAAALHLDRVYLSSPLPPPTPARPTVEVMGSVLAPAVARSLRDANLLPGDVLLVSSGRTVYEVAQYEMAELPGVLVVPTVGGNDQPEPWYQTNEITRLVAGRIGGRPNYLFAPALPGPDLHASLTADPSIQPVLRLWSQARCALMGIGAPPLLRSDIPQFVPTGSASLRSAVGDVCSRFYDRDGRAVDFPGRERLIAIELDLLKQVPIGIGVAVGKDKVDPIVAGAAAGFFNQLVTDPATATAIMESL